MSRRLHLPPPSDPPPEREQWQPRQRDSCPTCMHEWHGLPCRGNCLCPGSHLHQQKQEEKP
jgi:hypothetical protein